MSKAIPHGYEPFAEFDGFIGHNGPYYVKTLEDNTFRYGFATDERHGNPNNVIHGAALVGFVDTLLGHIIVQETGRFCATISLTNEFIAGTPTGGWIEATANIKKTTNSLAFANAEVYFEDTLLMSATTVYKLFGTRPEEAPDTAKS